jgi:hypothetical protein
MDLKNEFVPYQIALDMKSIGFDEPCFGYYYPIDNINFGLRTYININHQDRYFTNAPLYQQCWKWFREKYGLYFNIYRLQHKIGTKQEFMLIINAPLRGGYYETYEEAEFECLIRLIEIVKQKI